MIKFLKTTTVLTGAFAISILLAGCGNKPDTQIDASSVESQVGAAEVSTATGPALWLVKDADTNVYLFGTVHVLKPGTDWQTPKFNKAFADSDIIYQEADVGEAVQRELAALVPALGLYTDGRDLFEVLNEADEKEVLEAAEIVGLSPLALTRMKPWFAGMGLAQMQMIKNGYQAGSGVEMVIIKKANALGKTIRYFETAEQQLRLMAELPEQTQIEFLVAGAEAIEDTPNLLDDLVHDWVTGDVKGIADILSDEDSLGDRIVYEAMLVNRNRDWVGQINTLMDAEAGTFFISVGAAHLAGEDSVIAMLRAQGERVVRQ